MMNFVCVTLLVAALYACGEGVPESTTETGDSTTVAVADSTSVITVPDVPQQSFTDSVIPGQFIVTLRTDLAERISDSLSPSDGLAPISYIEHERSQKNAFLKELRKEVKSLGKILRASEYSFTFKGDSAELKSLLANKKVVRVVPNFYRIYDLPEPAAEQVAGQQVPWGVQRVSASSKQDGNYRAIWIIDTGVDTAHTDLNIVRAHCVSFVRGETVYDYNGHGTHVAGTIGAKASNNTGVIGVAPNAPIHALKVFDRAGRIDFSNAYLPALQYVKLNGRAGDVLNLSFSGFGENIDETKLIRDIAALGIKVVIAAGNANRNFNSLPADVGTYVQPRTGKVGIFPANLNGTNIFTISAFDTANRYWAQSNFGQAVDYSAPGVNILSTLPGNAYGLLSGTSMAAPHVSGLFLLRATLNTDGKVLNDPDSKTDPIAHE